jgi:hypothetical protein
MPHAAAGAEFLRAQGEAEDVAAAVAAHHPESNVDGGPYGALCKAADAVSASRPGARRETGIYAERLEKLEALAMSRPGVEKALAVQSGRDVRVMVDPDPCVDERVFRLNLTGLVPLRQASCHDDQPPGAAFLPRAGTADFLHSLFPGGGQEGAGIDPHHVRLVVIGGQAESVHEQSSGGHSRVHRVFRAAEADQTHQIRPRLLFFRAFFQVQKSPRSGLLKIFILIM